MIDKWEAFLSEEELKLEKLGYSEENIAWYISEYMKLIGPQKELDL